MKIYIKKITAVIVAAAMILCGFLNVPKASALVKVSSGKVLGDCNDDGTITAEDATIILIYFASCLVGESYTIDKETADVNSDGVVDAEDATLDLIIFAKIALGEEVTRSDYTILGIEIGIDEEEMKYFANHSPLVLADTSKTSMSYDYYNSQESGKGLENIKISASELKIIKKFADEHFDDHWTKAEKVAYTFFWIHHNVSYDYSYKKVMECSGYADCVFNHEIGQCLQYNGALLEMMTYLGYDLNLVCGYYGRQGNQHSWNEIKIDDTYYIMGTGNEGKNGGWISFCIPYDGSGYIKNYDYSD